jgi:hypothetical protein
MAVPRTRNGKGRLGHGPPKLPIGIGTVGFEPTASASQRRRSTRLSYVPFSA